MVAIARGSVLFQRYLPVSSFDTGYGTVHLAQDLSSGGAVALRTYAPGFCKTPEARAVFVREASRWIQIGAHPHVVSAHHVGQEEEQVYVVTDYIAPAEGVTAPWLDCHAIAKADPKYAFVIALGIARGMRFADERVAGIVHRDLKPGTVLLDRDGGAKVGDFGLAAALDATAPPGGTPLYMAPELFAGHADVRSDIYSFALLFLETLTGRMAVLAGSSEGLRHAHAAGAAREGAKAAELIPPLATWFDAALSVEPEHRPESWSAVEGDLASLWFEIFGCAPPPPPTREEERRRESVNALAAKLALTDGLADLGKWDEAKASYAEIGKCAADVGERTMQASAANGLAVLLGRAGDRVGALAHLDEALALRRRAGDRVGRARTLVDRGNVRVALNRLPDAFADFKEALAIFEEGSNGDEMRAERVERQKRRATARLGMAVALMKLGQLDRAEEMLRECVSAFAHSYDDKGKGGALGALAELLRRRGELAEALEYSKFALSYLRNSGDRVGEARELSARGQTLHSMQRDTKALASFDASLEISLEVGDMFLTGSNYFAIAEMTPSGPDHAERGRTMATKAALAYRKAGREDLALAADALAGRFTL